MPRFPIALTVTACLLFSASAAAQDYEIKLERPEKSGEKYRLNATLAKKESMTVTAGGMVVQRQNKTVNATLQAVVENLKVDDKGNVLKKQTTIEKFADDKGAELLKKGQVVVSETVDGTTKHQLAGGGTLETKALAAFKDLVKTYEPGKPSDEKAFGTDKRRKVGESWKVDSAAAAKALSISADAIAGTVKLEGIETVAGEKCLKLSAKSKITAFPNIEQLKKSGFKVKTIDFQIAMGGLLPIDTSRPIVSRTAVMTMKANLEGPNGVTLDMSMQFTGKRSRTPVKSSRAKALCCVFSDARRC